MLRIHQIRLPLDAALHLDDEMLRMLCAQALSIAADRVKSAVLVKKSVDARDKGDVHFVLTADVALAQDGAKAEAAVARNFKPNRVVILPEQEAAPGRGLLDMALPAWKEGRLRPVVVGAGPAGLFCALALAMRGARPVLIERGQPVEKRVQDLAAFETEGVLNTQSNVLFGEGGAGAFSDGKLTCGLVGPHIRSVLHTLVACGAPQDILIAQRPHIGTDVLRRVLVQMRAQLVALGAEMCFGHKLEELKLKEGRVKSVVVRCEGRLQTIDTDAVYLAIGHSARDTYALLHALGVPMQAKPFAVGVRIEHLQKEISRAQYGSVWQHPALPPAEYKLNEHTPDRRGVYTFCMCPGGRVIGAANEENTLNINGMSLHARNGTNANAALLVGVGPEDFGDEHPLAGVEFQRQIEKTAFAVCGGYRAPCTRVEDFLAGRGSVRFGEVAPSYRPGAEMGDVAAVLPAFVVQNLRYALPLLGKRLRGFDCPDALLTAPETRSSAPLRILRNEKRESSIGGLYPLGEGAGYAGGIVSAAVDGMAAGMA